MTQEHPIAPPRELVREWAKTCSPYEVPADHIATQAARWGADQELEACCEWLKERVEALAIQLRAARRPRPPSLKTQALDALETQFAKEFMESDERDIIRRALEALPD